MEEDTHPGRGARNIPVSQVITDMLMFSWYVDVFLLQICWYCKYVDIADMLIFHIILIFADIHSDISYQFDICSGQPTRGCGGPPPSSSTSSPTLSSSSPPHCLSSLCLERWDGKEVKIHSFLVEGNVDLHLKSLPPSPPSRSLNMSELLSSAQPWTWPSCGDQASSSSCLSSRRSSSP